MNIVWMGFAIVLLIATIAASAFVAALVAGRMKRGTFTPFVALLVFVATLIALGLSLDQINNALN